MKISQAHINYIQNVVGAAQVAGIESVSIEPNLVRGITDEKTVFILQTENVPNFDFGSVGINRMSIFQNRLGIVQSQPNFSVDCDIVDTSDGKFVKSVVFRSDVVKVDYKCANPKTILGVRKFNDVLKSEIQCTPEVVDLLQRGINAMKGEVITLVNNDKETFVEILDINNDVFKFTLPNQAELIDNNYDSTFAFRYPAKILLNLLKSNPDGVFRVGNRGILNVQVNSFNVYILPKI